MSTQVQPKFVLATSIKEFDSKVFRKLFYSAKSYKDLIPAKIYLCSYYAQGKRYVYKWDHKSQTFESYNKKDITDFHIQSDILEFKNFKGEKN